MENKFTLEYSEQQNMFHLNDGTQPKNTNGYITIMEDVTFEEYPRFINLVKNKKITLELLTNTAKKFRNKTI